MHDISTHDIILTRSHKVGRCPRHASQVGDEVWIALGCPLPLILRPQANGTYRHLSHARLSSRQTDEQLRYFTEESQPGVSIVDYIVQDIELE